MASKAGFKDLLLQKGEKFALIGALGLLGLFLVWGVVGALGADNPDKMSKDLDTKSNSVKSKIDDPNGKPAEIPEFAKLSNRGSDFAFVNSEDYRHIGKVFEPVTIPSQTHSGGDMALTLADAISKFGKSAKAKLQNPTASGEPEDQLRAPIAATSRWWNWSSAIREVLLPFVRREVYAA